ncbi:MAG: tRNA uridine-5-carboxymethylaminomethyl(34) synthesis GTPase MnmE [Lachnospiraceae bacterium]|nr:tRNA uridine-5-carboxymethylaminomethyl(34) synthesis GTPase MnmE [Lachnospiraceae bacterium]
MRTDTIASIATGRNVSGISIIRISGEQAVAVADRIFITKEQKHILQNVKSHTIHYGYVIFPTSGGEEEKEEIIDEVLVSVMLAPKSYTAEDVVEINCHGGITVTNTVLEAVLHAGARLAEPGEFTKRAFLNGRIDLSEAEAVMDLINASSKAAVSNSEKQLRGVLKEKIESLRKQILHETAFIESALDDPEHFDLTGYPESLDEKITRLLEEVTALLESSEEGALLKNGIKTVILGKPNVGKSTLLNLLLGQEKAIVTDIAGTTRDVLEETLMIRGIPFVLSDTAGIRNTADPVEKIGVDRAREAAMDADLVLYLVDSTADFDEEDLAVLRMINDKKVILLLNKSDLEEGLQAKRISEALTKSEISQHHNIVRILSISAKENKGIDGLKDVTQELFFKGSLQTNDQIFITNMRHKEALSETKQSLLHVRESIQNGMPEDFYSIDLMDAYTSLGRIIGQEVDDDLIEEIFSEFCMGK